VRGISGAARENFYAWEFDALFPQESMPAPQQEAGQ
jgi:hypothetical protein